LGFAYLIDVCFCTCRCRRDHGIVNRGGGRRKGSKNDPTDGSDANYLDSSIEEPSEQLDGTEPGAEIITYTVTIMFLLITEIVSWGCLGLNL
jgi:hypothetical protein